MLVVKDSPLGCVNCFDTKFVNNIKSLLERAQVSFKERPTPPKGLKDRVIVPLKILLYVSVLLGSEFQVFMIIH